MSHDNIVRSSSNVQLADEHRDGSAAFIRTLDAHALGVCARRGPTLLRGHHRVGKARDGDAPHDLDANQWLTPCGEPRSAVTHVHWHAKAHRLSATFSLCCNLPTFGM